MYLHFALFCRLSCQLPHGYLAINNLPMECCDVSINGVTNVCSLLVAVSLAEILQRRSTRHSNRYYLRNGWIYELQIWQEHSQGPSEQIPVKIFWGRGEQRNFRGAKNKFGGSCLRCNACREVLAAKTVLVWFLGDHKFGGSPHTPELNACIRLTFGSWTYHLSLLFLLFLLLLPPHILQSQTLSSCSRHLKTH